MPLLGVEALLELLEPLAAARRAARAPAPCRRARACRRASRLASCGFVPGLDPDPLDHPGDSTARSRCHRLGAMADRGSFQLGKVIDPATGKPGADDLVVGSSDLTTHGVIVGMTGSGKTGPRGRPARGGAPRGHPGADHRPEGRHGQPRAHVPRPRAGELPAVGERVRRAGRGDHGRAARREDGDDLARGPRGAGHRPRADPAAEGRGRRDDLHARLVRGRAAQRDRLAARAGALVGHRGRDAARRDRGHRDEPARPRRDHRRPAVEPRARAALEPDRERLAGRAATSTSAR